MKKYNHKISRKKLFREYTDITSLISFCTDDITNLLDKAAELEEVLMDYEKKKKIIELIGYMDEKELRDITEIKSQYDDFSYLITEEKLEDIERQYSEMLARIGGFFMEMSINIANLKEFRKDMEKIIGNLPENRKKVLFSRDWNKPDKD